MNTRPEPQRLLTIPRSLKYDLVVRQTRYEHIESLVSRLPGKLGMAIRMRLLRRFLRSCGDNVILWPGIHFRYPHRITLGNNVSISFDCILQGGGSITIGDNSLLGPGVKIWSVNHVFARTDLCINQQGYDPLPVVVGNDCWIGANSFIRPGARIPDGCVVLPGTVVGKMKLAAYSVVSGNPAKVLGPRNRLGAVMAWSSAP